MVLKRLRRPVRFTFVLGLCHVLSIKNVLNLYQILNNVKAQKKGISIKIALNIPLDRVSGK